MADSIEIQPAVSEVNRGPSLADSEVGAAKAPAGLLAFAPRFDRMAVVAAIVFQLIILVAMILGRTVPFVGAQTVLLKVEPVDPRDLLRGDYVTLGYAFNRVPWSGYQPRQLVYVTLVPESDGRHYRVGEFLHQPPASGVFIRGTTQGNGRATFGIESYYVQEGNGRDYESAARRRRLWAEVALAGDGNATLRGLVIE